ncbi:Disease resistance protein RGA2 [Morus notabilis]|uniref:Disease resistance protein RGA2 n=1 Tax=Morus notabilis TaxID=981085 RepID=W9QWU7_9ROSA|nr:disease resistance protein RGA2 [Morus notabilis]EXB56304.1 Disease resistance protein RGA2 [Morus notabilis]
MAEFVYGVAVIVVEKLSSISYHQICLALGLEGDLKRLKETMATIKDVLLDAEEKQAHDKRITSWLTQLKDVFLDAEDVLDEFDCEEQRRQSVKKHGRTGRKVRRFFSRSNPLVFRASVARAIKDIRERLDQIAADKKNFDLNSRQEERRLTNEWKEVHSFVDPSDVIGRDIDQKNIISLLTDAASDDHDEIHPKLSVIPIHGIPGVGKTTLTRLVYNHKRVRCYFELKMWVHVSKDFDVPRLIKEILDSATGKKNDNLTFDQVQTQLRDNLEGKRFLLVLDDVWNGDRSRWIELRSLLTGGSKGSKIIVTTRSANVGDCMGTISPYNLEGLSDEHSWNFFLKCAFKEGVGHEQNRNLLDIGRQILDKCKGIPLVVRTLGSLLYSNQDVQYWRYISESKLWEVVAEPYRKGIFAALLLSYSDLPFHLKRCFLYCSLFPKGKEIFSLELIQLWMAHGVLIPKRNEYRSLEDIGHQYFKELCSRSFFQYVKKQGWYYSFSMHELIHEFAQLVAQSECWIINSPESDICNRVRHLSVNQLSGNEIPSCLDNLNSVRTIIFPFLLTEPLSDFFFKKYLWKYECLRMLDLSYSSFETFPSYIGRMKQLRNLNLSHNRKLVNLPDSITKLQSLQILQLQGCSNLEKLPKNIGNLSSLMFLSITTKEMCFPENGIECLTSLRTLMIVSCNKLSYLSDRIMGCLTALETLVISYCENLALFDDQDEKVKRLSLQKLIFMDLPKMRALPRWLEGCQNTLQYLCLGSCPNLTSLPFWLPKTASLQQMEIGACPKLCSLPEGMHRLASLLELRIAKCPNLMEYLQSVDGKNWSMKIHFVDYLEPHSQDRMESLTSEEPRQTERFWTEEEDTKLIQTVVELYNKGKFKVEDSFIGQGYMEAIRRLLVAKFPEFDQTTEDMIESRIKTLVSKFHFVHEMLTRQSSGFLRDSKRRL